MKKMILLFILMIVFPSVLATDLQIEKQSSNEVLIVGLDKPVVFDLVVKNSGSPDYFEFYNLLGFDMFPKGTVYISQGDAKKIQIGISPIGEIKNRGLYTITYYIQGGHSDKVEEELTFKIIELQDAFKVGAEEFDPTSNSIKVYVQNKENVNFTDINAKLSSPFFTLNKEFSLGSYEKKSFTVQLNKEDFKELTAGFYTLKADLNVEGKNTEVEGVIKFNEKDNIITTQQDYGLIVHTQILKKVNEGNIITASETTFKRNIISRLFTTFSPEPDFVERQGFTVYYSWSRQIKPGETLEIDVRTNWLLPLLAVLFVIAVIILTKQYVGTDLTLRKKVAFVRAKGGEFALKVTVSAHAKKYLERVNIVDRLPPLVKLHEKFGAERPTKINEQMRRIEWNLEKLEAGEVRVMSYIIYSKIGVLGKFALPSATALFERDGKIKESESNRAFFVAEQKYRKDDEE